MAAGKGLIVRQFGLDQIKLLLGNNGGNRGDQNPLFPWNQCGRVMWLSNGVRR